MKIAFDYQTFVLQSYGGISRYFVRLAQELAELGENPHIFAPLHRNQYLRELAAERVHGLEIKRFPPKTTRFFLYANRILCAGSIKRFEPDLIHETYYTLHPRMGEATARVVTVYDMIHEKFGDMFPSHDHTSINKHAAVTRADHIICISENTKKDLCEIFDVPAEKVSVVYLGVDFFPSDSKVLIVNQTARPFLLYVGNRPHYKNFARMLQAIASRRRLMDQFDVIAFGGGPFNTAEFDLIKSLRFRAGAVRQVSGNDDALYRLYKTAFAFIFPSLYEGFGLPPLEAMAHGCPVVSSNTSSMPEVIGDAGEYFDPEDVDAQAVAIERVVFDEERRNSLVVKGQFRLNDFSWKKCALETRAMYRKVLVQRGSN
jgi:glycosyltransferase involved in cell wall biosynthesis